VVLSCLTGSAGCHVLQPCVSIPWQRHLKTKAAAEQSAHVTGGQQLVHHSCVFPLHIYILRLPLFIMCPACFSLPPPPARAAQQRVLSLYLESCASIPAPCTHGLDCSLYGCSLYLFLDD
jgi:hypothetical protein